MIFNLLQYINDSGIAQAGTDLFYGEAPYENGTGVDGIWLEERGNGTIEKQGCVTEEVDIYVRDCSATEAHKKLHQIMRFFQCSRCECIVLPDVTSQCCNDPDYYNQYNYKLILIKPIGTYENLGKDAQGKWLGRWLFEVKYLIQCEEN